MVPSGLISRVKLTPTLRIALIVVACCAGHGLYLWTSLSANGLISFPLDDAWIYQVYARNLAQTGQWAFVPGVPSTGSTSVLWTLITALGHLLSVDPRWWTLSMGLIALIAAALGAARLAADRPPVVGLAVGLAVGMEWHLVWASASGMETMLFAALLVWFWGWLERHDPSLIGHRPLDGLALGFWGGALTLTRPEGILALAAAGAYGLICSGRLSARLRWGLLAGLGCAVCLIPFFALNYQISGKIWPNTFYAKRNEYAVLWAQPLVTRVAQQAGVVWIGAQVLLLPGVVYELVSLIRRRPRTWLWAATWVWVIGHLVLYAARLPVTYQHGRYAIPLIPILVVYGVRGMAGLARPAARQLIVRVMSRVWIGAGIAAFVLFLVVLGAPAYARDTAFIETEMVSTALWMAANTLPDDTVAAHDIGALGYFAPRTLVDLAGLVSPEVIPVMTESSGLADFIVESGADYLVIFPRWSAAYEQMIASDSRFRPIWSTEEIEGYASDSGLGPMTVYAVEVTANE